MKQIRALTPLLTLVGLALVALVAVMPVLAATNAVVVGSDRDGSGDPRITVRWKADTDDGGGYDYVMGVCTDKNGNVVDTDSNSMAVGSIGTDRFDCDPILTDPYTEPVTIRVYDISRSLPENNTGVLGEITSSPILIVWTNGSFDGVPIPSGYVQHMITCDTPVYDAPGGDPVPGAVITFGQTWFLDPSFEDDAGWTAIFVAGPNVGYIPTSCVGPATIYGVPVP